ncbi:hypothetical protein HPB51_018461 [Rhipicephalus microplus]|uniref:Uncharacterized protein n=1 Tax=Rhipicephalus microplus TaxID=6941 RepID=A0A9J6DBD4_RHIMP|nr:hypothetical protein HPB51_018461 [Rhipicephalus microplus]
MWCFNSLAGGVALRRVENSGRPLRGYGSRLLTRRWWIRLLPWRSHFDGGGKVERPCFDEKSKARVVKGAKNNSETASARRESCQLAGVSFAPSLAGGHRSEGPGDVSGQPPLMRRCHPSPGPMLAGQLPDGGVSKLAAPNSGLCVALFFQSLSSLGGRARGNVLSRADSFRRRSAREPRRLGVRHTLALSRKC